jgi:hypothetical protein
LYERDCVLHLCFLRLLQQRDLDASLWFREIYGGPNAFGLEPSAVARSDAKKE